MGIIVVCMFIVIVGVLLYVRGVRSEEAEPLPRLEKILGVLLMVMAVAIYIKR